jgi:putative MATE family efflux protein
MVARRIGEKDPEQAAVAAVQAIILGVAVSGVTGLAGAVFAPQVLGLMGADAVMIRDGAIYTAVILGSSVTIFQLFLLNAIFRGAGDAAIALRTLMLANSINIVLDPCLIFGLGPFPELGLLGAAISTTIGRGTGVAFQLWVLFTANRRLQLERRHLRLDLPVMWRLLRVSMTGILQIQVATASWVALTRILATFGSAALAGNTFAIRTIHVIQLPAWGMSNAAATLVGQNLGAKKPDRAERAVWITGFYNMAYLCSAGLLLVLFAEPVIGLYSSEPEVLRSGVLCLRYLAYGWPFWAWALVLLQAFNGAGDTVTPSWINFFCYWIWQLPIAWFLGVNLGFGPKGVYLAILGTATLMGSIYFTLFRRGRWKHQRI